MTAGHGAENPVRCDLIVSGGTVLTVDARDTIIENGAIAVSNRRIIDVGRQEDILARHRAEERIDASGKVVHPSFIDAHVHVSQYTSRTVWNLIAALIADGVPKDRLFPLDLDRTFRKLDEIKSHVTVWWKSGDQSQQAFRSKEVVMAMLFAGRAKAPQTEGLPLTISWDNAPLDASFWGVLKDAKRPLAGLALLNFIYSRPEAHAAFVTESSSATGLKAAASFLDPAAARQLPTAPEIWPSIIPIDRSWLGANQEVVLKRWTEWLAR